MFFWVLDRHDRVIAHRDQNRGQLGFTTNQHHLSAWGLATSSSPYEMYSVKGEGGLLRDRKYDQRIKKSQMDGRDTYGCLCNQLGSSTKSNFLV